MQTIIKELAINPTIQEFMLNANIMQIFNQTWCQILFSGFVGSLIGGGISGGITYWAMKDIDNTNNHRWEKDNELNNLRWEKTTYKNFECEFWLNFYKEFHIVNRFIKKFLPDLIFSNQKNFYMPHVYLGKDEKEINSFAGWLKHFDILFDMVIGYEDLYIHKKNFDKTHIWIIWSIRGILRDYINDSRLSFENNAILDSDFYKELYNKFQQYYWDNIKMNNIEVNEELDKLWDKNNKAFDLDKVWKYFETQLDDMENRLQKIINGDLF